jgi:GNAT superfamily N-acetyltransferase
VKVRTSASEPQIEKPIHGMPTNLSRHVRYMTENDAGAVVELILQLNWIEDSITHDRSITRAAAAECLAANEKSVAEQGGAQFVAVIDGDVIGYICAVIEMAPAYIRPELLRRVRVTDLVVTEQQRRMEFGKALLAAAEAFTREHGIKQMLVPYVAGNHPAEALYSSSGFGAYSVERLKTFD